MDTGLQGIERIIKLVQEGGVPQELLLVVAALGLIVLLLLLRLGRGGSADPAEGGFDRLNAMLGRLEKLELTLNELKSSSSRSIELFKGDIGYVKQELSEIRKALAGKSSSGGGTAGGGGDGGENGGRDRLGTTELGNREREELIKAAGSTAEAAEQERASSEQVVLLTEAVSPAQAEGAISEGIAPAEVNRGSASDLAAAPSAGVEQAPESLSKRLTKSRLGFFARLRRVFSLGARVSPEMIDELEALLIESDLGVKATGALLSELREEVAAGAVADDEAVRALLKAKLVEVLDKDTPALLENPRRRADGPTVVMIVGVNGVGKTTTVAKLAHRWKEQGSSVMVVAADTFRAAADAQLAEWGRRIGVDVVTGEHGAKPATVVFDAMARAMRDNIDVVIIDTAGRLHTKSNLMQELEGMRNVVAKHQPSAPHETLLIVDGATGQNALSQAREFNQATPLTGLIVTKLDGTPKGGIVVAIKQELQVPIRFIGVGESRHDLRPFQPRDFVEALFDTDGITDAEDQPVSAHAETRRRRRRDGGQTLIGL